MPLPATGVRSGGGGAVVEFKALSRVASVLRFVFGVCNVIYFFCNDLFEI